MEVAGRGVDLALHGKYSPSGLVPVLHVDAETTVWDSLAIAEYANELAGGRAWPADAKARAHARCVTAEMHSGFPDLRAAMPMNIKMRLVGKPAGEVSEKVKSQLERITAIFTDARLKYGVPSGHPYLFGAFSAADAFYAPVVWRIVSYNVRLGTPEARAYVAAMRADPFMKEWETAALAETNPIGHYDVAAVELGGGRVRTDDEEVV